MDLLIAQVVLLQVAAKLCIVPFQVPRQDNDIPIQFLSRFDANLRGQSW